MVSRGQAYIKGGGVHVTIRRRDPSTSQEFTQMIDVAGIEELAEECLLLSVEFNMYILHIVYERFQIWRLSPSGDDLHLRYKALE